MSEVNICENIEKILNMKKISYKYMDALFKKYRGAFPPESTVNLFIDLPSTIKQLYNPANIKGISGLLSKKTKYIIAGCLLNMIAHYRHYFMKTFTVFTNVVFMYNSKPDKKIQNDIDPDYKKTYYEKRLYLENPVFSDLNGILRDNYKVMKQIIKCIPHAYFFDSEHMDYRCIFPYVMEKEDFKDNINIILTTDPLMYQNTLVGETMILQPKGEKSNIIMSDYIVKAVAGTSKTIKNNPQYLCLNPENILLIDSMINHTDLDTTGIRNFSYGKAITFLNKNEIDLDTLLFNTTSIEDIFGKLLTKDEKEKIAINMKLYNNFILANTYEKSLDLLYPNIIVDLVDDLDLVRVNNTYFQTVPMLLDFMFEGERLDG